MAAREKKGWQDELQSYLPHSLNCVDPNCLNPICVNLKLILRHVPNCDKRGDLCSICQRMKSLAANHANSCRDYYCRVPFCWEAKVASEQQKLIDELMTTLPDLEESHPGAKEAEQTCATVVTCRKTENDSSLRPRLEERQGETSAGNYMNYSGDGPSGKVQLRHYNITSTPPVSIGKTVPPEWTDDCQPTTGACDNLMSPSSQALPQQALPIEERKFIGSSKKAENFQRPPCQQGTKRKLKSFVSINRATKFRRSSPEEEAAEIDDSAEIIEIFSSKFSGKSTSKQKSETTMSSRPLSSFVRNTESDGSTPISKFTKPPRKTSTRDDSSDLPRTDFQACTRPESIAAPDSDSVFPTPPPSPPFETWFGEPASTNESVLKSVLLDTLFQLLGIVTQPKTRNQEAIFVDLLERTLRAMKRELQGNNKGSQ